MATAILDSEGRLQLPPEIIARLNLKPGDSVRVETESASETVPIAFSSPVLRPPILSPAEATAILNNRSAWADVDGVEYVGAIRQEWEDKLERLWGGNDTP